MLSASFKGTVALDGFMAYSFPSCLDRTYVLKKCFDFVPFLTEVRHDLAFLASGQKTISRYCPFYDRHRLPPSPPTPSYAFMIKDDLRAILYGFTLYNSTVNI